ERNKKVAPDQFKKSIHKKLGGGLDGRNTKKYLTQMSWLELIKFEIISIPYLIKYGYQPKYPMLNTALLAPIRAVLYLAARGFNNWRYSKRDRKVYEQSQ
ncbi:MAG: hypothetical protein WBA10_11295, partial [Elainellaceae cyanobacterium]